MQQSCHRAMIGSDSPGHGQVDARQQTLPRATWPQTIVNRVAPQTRREALFSCDYIVLSVLKTLEILGIARW